MLGLSTTTRTGLRERKKQLTRSRIIEVALTLCDRQGFDATTVEQIADAADVSPRTVNRYFDSKEAIVLGLIEDFDGAQAAFLADQPRTGNELEALRASFLAVIDSILTDGEPISFDQFKQMQRLMLDNPTVRARSFEYVNFERAALAQALADRLETEPDALAVQLVLSIWQVICHSGKEDGLRQLLDGNDLNAIAEHCVNHMNTAYTEFVRVCAVPNVSGPTAGSSDSGR
ncbi:TetR/AcrR family transcriptional regulator [Nocardia crassostreae]|uniref:TetR/AcrR family transcriptional regulator n=1 Tax=Nocardia crassostreae TaxID=53428 RepID=UPI00082B16D7|nr:TetR family transcriptional regulator [Nocardia crassostreae]